MDFPRRLDVRHPPANVAPLVHFVHLRALLVTMVGQMVLQMVVLLLHVRTPEDLQREGWGKDDRAQATDTVQLMNEVARTMDFSMPVARYFR